MLLVFILNFSYSEKLLAIDQYLEGDTLYVWAEGGLMIRDTNSITGKKISAIPYGEKVEVLESILHPNRADSIKFIEPWEDAYEQQYIGYYLKGRWVKIKFQGVYGFVFDGYLSHFPAPRSGESQLHENLPAYLERVFGVNDQYTRSGENYVIRDVYYGQGITLKNIGVKDSYTKYVFPNLSIQEVLIFIKNSRMAREKDRPMLLEVRKTKDSQTLEFKYYENGDGFLYLHEIGNTVILDSISSC